MNDSIESFEDWSARHDGYSNDVLGDLVRRQNQACVEALAAVASGPDEATFERMVTALENTYLDTVDRFDARNEFRVALRAALDEWPGNFVVEGAA